MIKELSYFTQTARDLPIGTIAYITIGEETYLVFIFTGYDRQKGESTKAMVALNDPNAFWVDIKNNTAKVIKVLPQGSKLEVC